MKKTILLVALMFVSIAAMSQIKFGVRGGMTLSTYSSAKFNYKFKPGIHIGGVADIPIGSSKFSFVPGVYFADKGTIGAGVYAGAGTYLLHSSWYANHYRAMAGVRGTFHYPIIDKLDTYAGIGLGLEYWSYKYASSYWGYDDYSYNDIDLDAGFFIGARYPLTEKFTVFGELGYGIGYLTAGISFKF